MVVKIDRKSGIPLIGCIAFGIIDRGTDLVQVRPTSMCNLKCPFCSTNANNLQVHPVNYDVELGYLLDYVEEVVKFKGVPIEANLDSVGEIGCYKKLVELIKGIKNIPGIRRISMQSNGTLIKDVALLEAAGLDQLNLSINALDAELAKKLSGTANYNLDKVLALAKMVADSSINLLIAPVWLPGVNDKEMLKLIEFAKKLNARIGIQKYEVYKHSRKFKGAKKMSYYDFYKQLQKWEKEFDTELICSRKNFNINKAVRLPTKFKKGEKVVLEIKAPGWFSDQVLAVGRNRCVTVNNCKASMGKKVRTRITDNKNNIYVAQKIK